MVEKLEGEEEKTQTGKEGRWKEGRGGRIGIVELLCSGHHWEINILPLKARCLYLFFGIFMVGMHGTV